MNFLSKTLIACAVISASVSAANAGVIIGGTRVVYDGNKKLPLMLTTRIRRRTLFSHGLRH